MFGHRKEAFLQLLAAAAAPIRLLTVRCQPPSLAARRGAGREVTALREELALLAGRLEHKTRENKALHAEKERCVRESEAYRGENIRLTHRIGYLDEQVQEMQNDLDKIKGVTDESLRRSKKDVQVFTKGPHTATIPVNVAGDPRAPTPTRRASSAATESEYEPEPEPEPELEPEPGRSLSPAARSDSAALSSRFSSVDRPHIYQNIRPKIKQKPRNILQRLQQLGGERRPPPPPPATDSEMGSSHSINTLDGKPRPPKKPARLSLHRATSVQSIKSADDTLSTASAGRRQQRADTVQTWPSVDRSLDQVRQHAIASLPRLARRERRQPV